MNWSDPAIDRTGKPSYGAYMLRCMPANTYGQYFDLDSLAGFCLLGFRGTAARALMTRLEGFLASRFCFRFALGFVISPRASTLVLRLVFGFLSITGDAIFLGVRVPAVSFLV